MAEPGTIIDGRYRVASRLGSGGMADVYLAHDELLGRDVAVKVLHRQFAADGEFVERFRREASSAAALSHPNIVAIFDRGEWDGTYYIAMELVVGRTLKAIVRETGALAPAAAIDIVVQVLRAARFAHKRGVIHRDLKPHNVILDEEGRARVTDFGIARAGASDMTLTGSIMGTAQYLSPEQAQGFAVSARSDLYSIGVILYELLTGTVPFEGETAVAIAFKQVSAAPRPPSELNPALPASLDAVVLRALAKDPAARYASAEELSAALERERAALPASSEIAYAAVASPVAVHAPARAPVAAPSPLLLAPLGAYGQEPAAAQVDQRRRRTLWWALIGVIAALAVAGALVLALAGPAKVGVPDVRGHGEGEAVAALRRDGLVPFPSPAPSATVPRGLVVSESPSPGISVSKGTTIQIVVSRGPSTATVLSVVGLTAGQARRRLAADGFEASVQSQPSPTVAAGHVISSEPAAGSEQRIGSTVTLLVSSGPAPVTVPDLAGQSLAAAESTLSNAGLSLGRVTRQTSTIAAPGTVLSQRPASRSSVPSGASVDLTVARASNEAAVPSVIGKSVALAAAALGEAGFRPKAVPVQTSKANQVDQVLTQAPAAGKRARKGSTVVIGIGVASSTQTTTTTTTSTTTPASTPPLQATG